jgi:hypothetical protein
MPVLDKDGYFFAGRASMFMNVDPGQVLCGRDDPEMASGSTTSTATTTTKISCKVFRVSKDKLGDAIELEINQAMTPSGPGNEVLVFKYRDKIYAVDQVSDIDLIIAGLF